MDITTTAKIEGWDEETVEELDGGRSIARAEVTLGPGKEGAEDRADGVASGRVTGGSSRGDHFYRADKTGTYTTFLTLDAVIDGRAGSFTAVGTGTFDGSTASGRFEVVEGSGTGELEGVTGTVESDSTHADYPYLPLVLHVELP